ncbi:hypothetical protein ACH4D5_23630 [Streptomyces sp. NPDC018029]|uniref:hypothetical protein n=1 Tax=Streptomyces sp. NPDC018029 TaxID=3365032 RepID=UPI0037A02213
MRSGRRASAVALLGDAVQHDPADHRVTHTLAVALLNSPASEGGCAWERCVAAWAALLHDAGFWEHVLSAASRRYGVPVEPSLVPVLRAGLREVLEQRMPDDTATTRVAPGPLLQREADAAKLLAAVGGFPSAGGGGAPLFCGPLRIAELGRSADFGAFAATQGTGYVAQDAGAMAQDAGAVAQGAGAVAHDATATAPHAGAMAQNATAAVQSAGPETQGAPALAHGTGGTAHGAGAGAGAYGTGVAAPGTEAGAGAGAYGTGGSAGAGAYSTGGAAHGAEPLAPSGADIAASTAPPPPHPGPLAFAFSELGFAQLLLRQDKAADALAALSELRCAECRAARGGPGAGAVCEPGCVRFDELNPGYAGLPDKHRRLALDARGLALEARLSMGRAELREPRPDFGAAAAYWRRALVHSRELDRYRETQTAIVDMALGAARDAHRAGRLTLAVDTLDMTRSVIGANERGRIEGQLARVLADRGISVANDDEALLDQPAADLRRSVAFNPHLLRAQVSLGVVLRGLALARWSSGSLSGARATLREAIDQLTAALTYFPDDPYLEEQREAAVADLDHVMWQPDESGQ